MNVWNNYAATCHKAFLIPMFLIDWLIRSVTLYKILISTHDLIYQ